MSQNLIGEEVLLAANVPPYCAIQECECSRIGVSTDRRLYHSVTNHWWASNVALKMHERAACEDRTFCRFFFLCSAEGEEDPLLRGRAG